MVCSSGGIFSLVAVQSRESRSVSMKLWGFRTGLDSSGSCDESVSYLVWVDKLFEKQIRRRVSEIASGISHLEIVQVLMTDENLHPVMHLFKVMPLLQKLL